MTIGEAIAQIDELKPNQYTTAEKVAWLDQLEGLLYEEVFRTHINCPTYSQYTEDTDQTTKLLVPAPYDGVYVAWLTAQIDYNNGELIRYNNSMEYYNTLHKAFCDWYNRNVMPKQGSGFIYF